MDRIERIRKIAEDIRDGAKELIDSMRPKVLLMGPDMSGDSKGAKLRLGLKELCWEMADTVITEHREIERARRHAFGQGGNLAAWELHVAKDCEVVIILPDSPGSFAELGQFAMSERVCRKTLVIFDKQYQEQRHRKSYIQQGPRKAAQQNGARIHFVDYADVDRTWKKVQSFIQERKRKMAEKKLLLGS